MAHKNQDRFVNELNAQCNTFGKVYAAAKIVARFSSTRTHLRARNRLLLAMLAGYQHRKEAAWCVALLRVVFCPTLQKVSARYPELTWAEIQSAFYYAVEEYPLHRRKYALLTFRQLFIKALFGECSQDLQAQELSEALQEDLRTHSLPEVMGRAEKTGLDKGEVKVILIDWVCGGVISSEKASYVLERLFPARIARSAAERQRASRGFRSAKEQLKANFRKR